MASTFAELFSDFKDQVKIYVEKLDITEPSFMRMYTRGMQKFQRDVELIQMYVQINIDTTVDKFYVPDDLLRIVELKDDNGYTLVRQEFTQFNRNAEKDTDGYIETPKDYSMRLKPNYKTDNSRMYTVANNPREFLVFPLTDTEQAAEDTVLHLWYIPDIHAFSSHSLQWVADTANPGADADDWFPLDTMFMTQFVAKSVNPLLSPYEDAFLNYAIMLYIQSQGSMNYKVFEKNYKEELEKAIMNKPLLFSEGVRDYFLAPYS